MLFGQLLSTGALPWHVLAYIRLNVEDTTSSSRIFTKTLFLKLSDDLGIKELNERLQDPTMQESFESIFPKDNLKNIRFAINFFTEISLAGITNLREYLKNMPRLILQKQKKVLESESGLSSGSDNSGPESDSESDSSSSSSSDESNREKRKRRRRS
ncbi:hypothetical protein CARUB_v10027291mg [Capsella rubella]|uniref:Pre-mRNA-splicing factor CWC22 homolog n=1 Tax=Capsella rubella TaxID=81985 RepID=R0EYX8_9BRAS|nr:pre-mRNA-splicing factor CWC22 homolog [Capsella rubella]EOA14146.1 hypothetical protein CARUB_v10027291mg [Capsella rubella]